MSASGTSRHCAAAQQFVCFRSDHGAEAVSVADLGYVFSKDSPLHAKLEAGL
jgi:hypothetical protein